MEFKQLSLCTLILICLEFKEIMSNKNQDTTLENVSRAEVQSCRGCALNRLMEVKKFIYEDLPKYSEWVSFKAIPGAMPDLVLFNKHNKEIDRIDLSPLSRKECNNLVHTYSMKIKDSITGQQSKSAKARSEL